MNRRAFLTSLAQGTVGSLALKRKALAASTTASQFKLGITTDEVSQDFEQALKFAQGFDLKWVEVRHLWDQYVTEVNLEDLRQARRLLDRHQIKVSVLDTALYKCAMPGTQLVSPRKNDYPYDGQQALLKRAIERAGLLGTRYLRVFSFWRAKPANELFERAVEHLAKSVQVAAAADCVLLLENVGGCVAETAAEAARFLSAIPSPHFGLVWDPNNAYCAGEHPFPEGYEKLDKRRVYHIHLRDARRNTQTGRCDWLPVGKGEIDNLGQLRALAEDKFQGTVSLETHYQRPDKNKELASRESLKGLLGLLEQV